MLMLLLPSISSIPRYVNGEQREINVSGGWRIFGEGWVDIKLPGGTYAYPRFGFNFEASGSWEINTKTSSGGLSGSFSLEYILIYENYTERHHAGGSIEGNVTFQYPAASSDYNSIELSCNIHMYGYEYSELVCDAFFVSNNVFLQIFPEEGKSDFYWYPSSGYIVLFDCDAIYPPGFAFWDSHGEIWVETVKGFPPPVTEEGDFELSVSPDFQSVNPSDSATYRVTIKSLQHFNSEVFLDGVVTPEPKEGEIKLLFYPGSVTPPPDGTIDSTLTVVTESATSLGQYTIMIKATSGSITHSVNITLFVGYRIEIEITKFNFKINWWLRPFPPALSNIYFVAKINNEASVINQPTTVYYPDIGEHPGGLLYSKFYIKLPFNLMINATDSREGVICHNSWTINDLSLPFEFFCENSYIKFEGIVRSVNPSPLKLPKSPLTEKDDKNLAQWYWYEIGMDKVLQNYEMSQFDPVVVAVLDTGVYWEHPDLKNQIWINEDEIPNNGEDDDGNGYVDDFYGFDFIHAHYNILNGKWYQEQFEYPKGSGIYWYGPMDDSINHHGTKVAGVISSEIGNGGIAGISPNVKLMIIKVLDENMNSKKLPYNSITRGIRYAIENGAQIISMSFGTYAWLDKLVMQPILQEAYKKGILLVAASGNGNTGDPLYPASISQVISVAALSRRDDLTNEDVGLFLYRWPGSNFGPDISDCKESVEISAPGYSIFTTDFTFSNGYVKPSWSDLFIATSSATPIVSGVSALIMGYAHSKYQRALNPNEVRYILRESASDLGSPGWDPYYGYGIVNAYKALQKVDELLGGASWQIRLDPPANLDLHVYDPLGHHVGLNYETGELELEIAGAVHTGDESGGFETIFLPLNIMNYQIKIVNRDGNAGNFTLEIASFDDSGNLLMKETRDGSVQANSEIAYVIEASETGEFYSYQFSLSIDKVFKPYQISCRRRGAILSRTNITNTGELNVTELIYEDIILHGWTVPDYTHPISVTLFIDGNKYKIPYEELTYVTIEGGKYKLKIDFSNGIDLYQCDPILGEEVYVTTIYAFQPEWVIEIKYPMIPPENLQPDEYASKVSVTAVSSNGVSITLTDTATLIVLDCHKKCP